MAKLPLEGIRVVDLTVVWAGPYACMHLADWGAQVIRPESTQHFQAITRGTQTRPPQPYVDSIVGGHVAWVKSRPDAPRWNQYVSFNAPARNKLSCSMDLSHPQGIQLFKRLIAVSDVMVENNSPRVIESLGLSYEALKQVKPDLIMVSMPGFGLTGPYRNYRCIGPHQEGFIGHTYLRGCPDEELDTNVTVFHIDEAAGVAATLAVLTALHYRNRTGKGQFIELTQTEATIPQLGEAVMDCIMNGRVHQRIGNRDVHGAIQGCYRCKGSLKPADVTPGQDKWVNITIRTDQEWQRFCRAAGHPEWASDERFADQLSRLKNHDAVDGLIGGWTIQHDHYAIMHQLQREGVPAGPVMDEAAVYSDHHLKERGFFERLTQADCGTHLYPGLAWRLSKMPNKLRLPPCRLGEHNEYVYKQVLGVSDEEYARLVAEGHIGTEYGPSIP
jgi:crotonobetainyl-CoA:carnitine CoA-transferase CaiB-like acyl-CoA transferase